MNLKTRFSLIGGGITIFLILAPFLVLYARGFKYDFETNKLIKTGILVVKSEPSKTILTLEENGKELNTPKTVRFLLPGDYNIKLQKDGYQTWRKRLTVNSQFVTWASLERDKIHLFYESPKLGSTWTTEAFSISADKSEIAFQAEGVEYKIAVASGQVDNLGQALAVQLPLPPETSKISWTNASQIWQLLQTTDIWPLSSAEFEKMSQVYTNGNHTAILVGTDLYSFEIATLSLIDNNVSGLTLSGDDIWYSAGSELRHHSFASSTTNVLSSDFPAGTSIEIIRAGNQLYTIVNNQLYQLKDKMEKIYGSVSFARWEDHGQRLVYGNSNEVYLHNPISNSSTLALRSLSPISQVQLNWTTGHIFYINENKAYAAELDTRNGQNQFPLLKLADNSSFIVSPDGSKAYVITPGSIQQYLIR